jgi:hypothetical protein
VAAFVCDENVLIDNSIRNLTSDEIKIITSYTNTGVQQWLSEHSSATTTRSKISYVCPICLPVGVKELAVKKGLVDYLSLTHHILAGIQLATLTVLRDMYVKCVSIGMSMKGLCSNIAKTWMSARDGTRTERKKSKSY